eukprot:CAMPEP_0169115192 /NCGR_PEP_ID=MMETSP1015-20121227/29205_1 /TAXON_ID=342587 /ORGANISM="Karlodinium micrum, Strain CCMP2283" /LENGTH=75 /DNA_ID=CAMNT_0009177615 /DNA_START=173 /DNA_END=400 /DNA_ORIENTATION=-
MRGSCSAGSPRTFTKVGKRFGSSSGSGSCGSAGANGGACGVCILAPGGVDVMPAIGKAGAGDTYSCGAAAVKLYA